MIIEESGVFVPDQYVNQIRWRKAPRLKWSVRPSDGLEVHFPTWKEAHEWMIIQRRKRVEVARKELKSAERQLENAYRMPDPERTTK